MYSKINTLNKHKKWHGKRKWIFVALLVIALVFAGVVFANNRRIHNKQVSTHIPSKGPVKAQGGRKSDKAASNTGGSGSVSDKSTGQSTTLIEPSGTFVSNHRPSLSGAPLLRQEKSVCNTAPGASCYILFMKDGVAKQLDPQTVGSNGSTYWIWDVNQAGLTQGSWKITAVATMSGQTKTADDSLPLEVQP